VRSYLRPIGLSDAAPGALRLAGGPLSFDRVELILRGEGRVERAVADLDTLRRWAGRRGLGAAVDQHLDRLSRPRPAFAGSALDRPGLTVSVDTRHAAVMRAALAAGARIVNDVTGLTGDPASLGVVARAGCPVVLMHIRGEPRTMQENPVYDDVLLDVFDWLEQRVAACAAAGIPPDRVAVDPGIGFGKRSLDHNLPLLRGLSLLHGLGCAVLLGVSRKRFIGTLSGSEDPKARVPGSIAAGLYGIARGVQILRVHDVAETRQALAVWSALQAGIEGGD
jgi:dihydropteroate synthase